VIEVTHQINEVRRAVGSRVHEAGELRSITISQTYQAELDDVWDACTSAERIPRWLMPVSGELRLGGHYQLEGNAGGKIERCDPPNGFAATWEYGGEVSWIELSLTEEPTGGTKFTLVHLASVDDTRWSEFGPGAVGVGWDMMVMGLAEHLRTGEAVDPSAAMAWVASDDGREFITTSSERWRDASVAAGTDPEEARTAAERTTAAYTGS
jgi:uncharacterized protein YndB with AHSA1/START domain